MELVIAIMILGIVMTALGPAFYSMMRATTATNQRSVADGIAVAATEQLRALPYYDVGYTTPPDYCLGSNPVQLSYYSPVDDLAKTKTVGTETYTIQTCIYWVQAGAYGATTYTNAYKETVVKVMWGEANKYSFTESSAIYPGGESAWDGGSQNFAPSSATTSGGGAAPSTPTANYASNLADAPTSVVQVDWQPVTASGETVTYIVEWWTGPTRPTTPSQSPDVNGTSDGAGGLFYQVSSLTPGVAYSFDVIAVASNQYSSPSNVVSSTTASASASSCVVNGINVTPSSPVIDTGGNPVGFSSLAVTVQANSLCTNLTVEYGLNGPDGAPSGTLTTVPLTYSSGSFTGNATQSTWSAATYGFVVYNSGSATTAQANVTPCQEQGTTGHC